MITRTRRRRRVPRDERRGAILLLALGVVAVGAFAAKDRIARPRVHPPSSTNLRLEEPGLTIDAAAADRITDAPNAQARRVVYPFSIVPGGVRDARELRDAALRDSVVATHYAGVAFASVRARRLQHERSAYMSYRRGSEIYWTQRPVALKAGETILDDGDTEIRGRCGNLISDEPQTPTDPNEPPPTAFDTVEPEPPIVPGGNPRPIAPGQFPAAPGTVPGGAPPLLGAAPPSGTVPPDAGDPGSSEPPIGGRVRVPFVLLGDRDPDDPTRSSTPPVHGPEGQPPHTGQPAGPPSPVDDGPTGPGDPRPPVTPTTAEPPGPPDTSSGPPPPDGPPDWPPGDLPPIELPPPVITEDGDSDPHEPVAIPEPSAIALMLLGLSAAAARARRRR